MHHAQIDNLACQDSPIHRLDGRLKLVAVVVFSGCVISTGPAAISILALYAVWPFVLLTLGKVPLKFVIKHILIASPFVAVLAIASIFYLRGTVKVTFGPLTWTATEGILRCISILCKFAITMSALVAVTATTRFGDLLAAMSKLHVPKLLVMQLGFLYRYIFMLINRADHTLHARKTRHLRNLGVKRELKTAASIVGALFLSSLDSAQRINTAMQARGFDGDLPTLTETKFGRDELVFSASLAVYLVILVIIQRSF